MRLSILFIHRILLFLALDGFPFGESVHVVPLPPSSTGADAVDTSSAVSFDANVPPPTTSDDSDIRRTLDHVLTVQAAHG